MKGTLNFLAGMIIGVAIGAVAALIYAPQSGAELRANLQEQAVAERQRLQALYEQQLSGLRPHLEKLQNDVQTVIEQTKQAAEAESDAGEDKA